MIQLGLTWEVETASFFVIDQGLKVNGVQKRCRLKEELFYAIKKVYRKDDWILNRYEALSHRPKIVNFD